MTPEGPPGAKIDWKIISFVPLRVSACPIGSKVGVFVVEPCVSNVNGVGEDASYTPTCTAPLPPIVRVMDVAPELLDRTYPQLMAKPPLNKI